MGERFIKMHGLGNDFVVLDHLQNPREISAKEAAFWADRRLGVGCDQLVQLLPGVEGGQAEMRIYNPDGSRAEMCGNAMRCVGLYLKDQHGLGRDGLSVETMAGMIRTHFGDGGAIAVDMGTPRWSGTEVPHGLDGEMISYPVEIEGENYAVTAVSMGNPHAVVRVKDAEGFPLEQIGPQIENHALFPNRINFEVIQVLGSRSLRMRVWERGAGITMACGTGACASAVVAMRKNWVERKVEVTLDGGKLEIEWRGDDRVIMTGPATEVFRGELSFL
uniref:Diaminopimelate epimerase n=1 Tax=Magnetococcus massalia (strain MO-1) TaxID=451514 RepID=A0A1S7LP86_MAGMO|nr:Diaminopimelate epimerase (DAP epimerase) [Candidatus Magnetococcus massalia]